MNQDNNKNYTVTKFSLTLRVLVSVYLLYTAWQIRRAPLESEGMQKIVFIAAIILFVGFALLIGGRSLYDLAKGHYSENNPPQDKDL